MTINGYNENLLRANKIRINLHLNQDNSPSMPQGLTWGRSMEQSPRMDRQTESCIPFCKAILSNRSLALREHVLALLEPFWDRCRDPEESLERWVRALGLWAESIYFEQRAISARKSLLEMGPATPEECCSLCGGAGYSVTDGTVELCKSCMGFEWKFG